jgi:subtilisin family serine protease
MTNGFIKALAGTALAIVTSVFLLAATAEIAIAKDHPGSSRQLQRYVIELQDPPLALYDGGALSADSGDDNVIQLPPTAPDASGEPRLDLHSSNAVAYLKYINERHEEFALEVAALLGREAVPVHSYRLATNGMAMDLRPGEASLLAGSSLVSSISKDTRHQVETYAGPPWLGAEELWNGDAGFSSSGGENIIIGVIDYGINWEHPSFTNPSPDGYNHSNPLGQTLGLCSDEEVVCDGKIIGVYDFVEDDPSTDDVVEENTKGRDNDGHGSHVSSIAAGNTVNTFLEGEVNTTLSGVAPRANIIAYRVCFVGEPAGFDTGGCMGSAILSAIDQAIEDGVDVINYSIGSVNPCGPDECNPWAIGSVPRAYLAARGAGIFLATSAGNSGPLQGTLTSPANSPWMVAVGYATHNSIFGSVVEDLAGGDTQPPGVLIGASLTEGIGVRKIVHAKDFGSALCGTGESESGLTCDTNIGLSNPWDGEKPFNGEIVVCDRGTYGRVEKGKNVLLAGAGGYILANTGDWGEAIVADEHCLPSSHIGLEDADQLRSWLGSGSDHQGSISGIGQAESEVLADQINIDSSRGPAQSPVEDVLKPNLMAPGVRIYAAGHVGQEFVALSGSSMSAPHVAGAAALLKSVHPQWGANQLASALETTATAELATDRGLVQATPHESGAGRPQLAEAANAGLYLEVTTSEFQSAYPAFGGEPSTLNLPGVVSAHCQGSCDFKRRLTDMAGGASWTATAVDFPPGVTVDVSPSQFTLGSGATRELDIHIDVSQTGAFEEWSYGRIRLSASGFPDQYLTVAVFSIFGDLPSSWTLSDDRNGGWQGFGLTGLTALPDATFRAGELVKPTRTTEVLIEDPTRDNPYDGEEGVFTVWHELPQGGLWLNAETLDSTAFDVDLYVGRDDNGNGLADPFEERCASTSEGKLESCDLFDLPAGDYWVLVQNWSGTNEGGDEVTALSTAVGPSPDSGFAASGPGITAANNSFPVRVSWDNWNALPGEEWLAAVGIGSSRNEPNNVGVIPVRFTRSGIADAQTFPLTEGAKNRLALDAGGAHDRLFIDVPPGTGKLSVFSGSTDENHNDDLTLELKRLDFEDALGTPPFAASPANAPVLVSASGSGGAGPSISVINPDAGRWYAVMKNGNDSPSAIEIRVELDSQGAPFSVHPGLWSPSSRPQLGQGYEYNWGESSRALVWYTYDEDGQPSWFISAKPVLDGNLWTADLLRYTNDGAQQQSAPVGRVSISQLDGNDAMFSYTLFGLSGTERMQPISLLTCPQVDGVSKSYTGLWSRATAGLGGASVLVNANTQSQIHYLYDDFGVPRWLYAQDVENPEPTNPEIPILQFHGYCAVCAARPVGSDDLPVGTVTRTFDSESAGSWTLDYLFNAPLSGTASRTDQVMRLTHTLECQ